MEDGKEQPADTPSATGTHGLGNARSQRLLCQLGEAKQELKKEVRLRAMAEEGLKKAEERNESLLKAYSWDAQGDLRKAKEETARVVLQRQEMVHKLKVIRRDLDEARQYEGRQEDRLEGLKVELSEARAELKAAAQRKIADQMVAEAAGAQRVGTAEAGPGTTRKAVVQPPSTSDLAPKRLKMQATEFCSWDEMSDRWHDAQDELIAFQQFVKLRDPGAPAAWLAKVKAKQQGKQSRQKG